MTIDFDINSFEEAHLEPKLEMIQNNKKYDGKKN